MIQRAFFHFTCFLCTSVCFSEAKEAFKPLPGSKKRMSLSPSLSWQPEGISGAFTLGNVAGWKGKSNVLQLWTQGGYFYTPWLWAGMGIQVYGSTLEGASTLNGTSLHLHAHTVWAKPFEYGLAFGILGRVIDQNLDILKPENEAGVSEPTEREKEFQNLLDEAVGALTWAGGYHLSRLWTAKSYGEIGLSAEGNLKAKAGIGPAFDLKRLLPGAFAPTAATTLHFQWLNHWPYRPGFEGMAGFGFAF
jgi:hypothetical protein